MASKLYRADAIAAKAAAYRYAHNPFEAGTRRHRLCKKAREHKAQMDAMDDDLEAVYGPLGVKRDVIQNVPGTMDVAT